MCDEQQVFNYNDNEGLLSTSFGLREETGAPGGSRRGESTQTCTSSHWQAGGRTKRQIPRSTKAKPHENEAKLEKKKGKSKKKLQFSLHNESDNNVMNVQVVYFHRFEKRLLEINSFSGKNACC